MKFEFTDLIAELEKVPESDKPKKELFIAHLSKAYIDNINLDINDEETKDLVNLSYEQIDSIVKRSILKITKF